MVRRTPGSTLTDTPFPYPSSSDLPCCAAAATATIWTEGGGLAAKGRVMSQSIVTVDIGGTHARFAIAEVEGGRCIALGGPTTLHTEDQDRKSTRLNSSH